MGNQTGCPVEVAVWLTSPDFTVETMAVVINRVQTAPASAHKNTIQEIL